ncbi:lytic transglycosylase domain-containing protein [Sphingomonas morindae]|uniref:Lytic transglycosylase domain-containing protein n=1 Tax=Sphingomonas morindae TaxID=1541170 RepID=A0ABY4X4P7_9SPHN|nr:lytic transglycosylase domain-containing protein [Sphingomonas morindae]USI71873.1 lytic transglycosylase domain-containing protein [Sphingomonas morindae]
MKPHVRSLAALALAGSMLASAALAADAPAPAPSPAPATPPAPAPRAATAAAQGQAGLLDPQERQTYRAVFDAIRAGAWSDARAGIAAAPDSLLAPVATAELFLAKNSPRVERDDLLALLARAPELPQAPQLALLARKRGVTDLPLLPQPRDLDWLNGAPARVAASATAGDVAAAALAQQARPLLKADQPAAAEALLATSALQLTPEARTEWQQRIAWSYYLNGDDASATRLAGEAARGPGGWAVQAAWVAGLSAWRQRDCQTAEEDFARVSGNAGDAEMKAAGLFWTARAELACGRFDRVQAKLRAAARVPETFYGLLAARMLGMTPKAAGARAVLTPSEWTQLATHIDVRRAAALVEVGELGLADEMLRWQAKIGTDAEHRALLHLAAQLNLPATQIWLAHNAPAGQVVEVSARYPAPNWIPQGGWQIDRALVFAHALQESRFRTDAVSPAGAYGLMQVLPGTADLIERRRGGSPVARTSLSTPAINMAYGQAYLEQLASAAGTGGLLPKVIAAYNAGPNAVARWDINNRAQNDPLLYIESIPYAETRAYVATVLRNYWMYQAQAGERPLSLKALAQGRWPRFPGLGGDARAGLSTATTTMTLRSGAVRP